MSFSKLSMGLSALVLALAAPGASTAAGNRAGSGLLLPKNNAAVGGASSEARASLTGVERAPVRAAIGNVTTATRELDLGSLSAADFGDEPAPADRH